ncbi:unnamed protein product [Effrenium voratum]|uniref:Uncharacterized protein n=1 Tax=Effrenium voratum TaxID=2562239 RepID=A0AA36J2U3_9DINO|nr:unnamed protein product [Effrenium voratum]CAJ1398582.1 unnamed protein product [Effrenium voratum]
MHCYVSRQLPRTGRTGSRFISGLRLCHTQLLLRGGARTPLEPLEPESYWRDTLPNEALLRRLTVGEAPGGPRRRRGDEVWGQLTERGVDESNALGARLERWLAEHHASSEDEAYKEMPTMVLTSPDYRSSLTARAVLSGLFPPSQRADAAAVQLRTLRAAQTKLHPPEEKEDEARQDTAMDLTELLALEPDALEGACECGSVESRPWAFNGT